MYSNNNSNINDSSDEPEISRPPTEKRSPLLKNTCRLMSGSAGNSSKSKSGGGKNSKPSGTIETRLLERGIKTGFAALTVSASIIGAVSTLGGFASSLLPLGNAPVYANSGNLAVAYGRGEAASREGLGPIAIGNSTGTVVRQVDQDGPLCAFTTSGTALGLCPLQSTTMNAKLSGYVARVTVTQVFTNPFKEKIEATYSLPLADESAVDDMTIKVGERTIKGEIKRRAEAAKIYETAKQTGNATALLNQERTNIFTQKVANIEPGKSIVVKVSYVELLKFEDGKYTFAMPTTIGPRFFPTTGQETAFSQASDSLKKFISGNEKVGMSNGHNLFINVDLDAGLPIKNVKSPLFPIMVDRQGPSHSTITLKKSAEVPNKDFVLTYELDNPDALKSGYLAYKDSASKTAGADGYATFMLLPPAKVTSAAAAPKEMIFLVDSSGSQSGKPIAKAKETLHYIVDHMNANDTFQILAFNDEVSTMSDAPLHANAAEKRRAHEYISRIEARGGTWMAEAVQRVLHARNLEHDDLKRLKIVTFMTDGFVGNDGEILSLIQKERGDSRWFVFGTGNSVNRNLVDNVARLGGGEADYVLLNSSAEEVGKKFYSRIASPALTNVKLRAEGLDLYDVLPGKVNDVWANKPLYFTARYHGRGRGKVVLTGYACGRPYSQTLDVDLPEVATANSAIEKVWARQQIAEYDDQMMLATANNQSTEKMIEDITRTALAHSLMSQFTSFVAVDEAPASTGPSMSIDVPNLQPEGVQESPQTATNSQAFAQPTAYISCNSAAPVLQGATAAAGIAGAVGITSAAGIGGAPGLQGATNGTIAPQGSDATLISGVNTAGTVRVNNWENLEALLNFLANGIEIIGLAWGGANVVIGIRRLWRGESGGARRVAVGTIVIIIGLAAPGGINYLVATVRETECGFR